MTQAIGLSKQLVVGRDREREGEEALKEGTQFKGLDLASDLEARTPESKRRRSFNLNYVT